MKHTKIALVAASLAIALLAMPLLGGCSGKSGSASGDTVTVTIKDLKFTPRVVKISPGTKVRWVNEDTTAHTSTSADFSPDATTTPPGAWNSPVMNPGESFTRTFKDAGTFDYACSIHPYIKGTVEVK